MSNSFTPGGDKPARHALITGGSRGIGLAVARSLWDKGYSLTLVARDKTRLSGVAASLQDETISPHRGVQTIAVDLRDTRSAYAAVTDGCAKLGPPDVLVCAAGIARPLEFDALTVDDFRELLEVNFLAVVSTIKAALPRMKAARRGHIVLVSSGSALIGLYGQSAYGASKFALRGLAEALRAELRDDHIRISICYPPNTDTDMLAAARIAAPPAGWAVMSGARTLSAETVARAILDGIERNRFEIAPGLEMSLLNRFHSVLKPLLFAEFDRKAWKARDAARTREVPR
jgi:3-dehydrosphinganine reductase